MLWRLTGVRSRMLAWACLACALFLGASGVAIAALYDRMDTRELAAAGALLAAGVALIFASGWGFARSITGLLVTATDFTRQIAAGNLSTPLPPASLRDEIGALKFSLEVMRKSLVSITRDVHQGIESALHSAAEIADGNADLSAHTQRQAASLEEAAASMAQLASTVKQNASSAFEADQKAGQATDVARRGGEVVGDAVQAMQGIVQSTSRISEIVGIIDGIAFQTNILALNAAVEAARPAAPARASRWWRPRCAAWRRKAARRRARSGTDRDIQPAGGRRRAPRGARRRRHAGHRDIREAGDADRQRDRRHLVRAAHRHRQRQPHHFETDTAAQRNAARVEQASLAVENLRTRGAHLRHAIEVFRVAGAQGAMPRRPIAQAEPLPSPRRQIPLLERQLP